MMDTPVGLSPRTTKDKHVIFRKNQTVGGVLIERVEELLRDHRRILALVRIQDDILKLRRVLGLMLDVFEGIGVLGNGVHRVATSNC